MIITPNKLNRWILENKKIRVIDLRSKEQIEEMAKEYNSNKILGFKVPIILEKYFEDKKAQEKYRRSKRRY